VDSAARDVVSAYRLRRLDRVRFLILPSSAPFVATGIPLAATISCCSPSAPTYRRRAGLGAAITQEQQNGDIPGMWVTWW